MKKYIYWVLLVLWLILAVFLSRQTGEETADLSGGISAWLTSLLEGIGIPVDPASVHALVRKAAHVAIFLVLGFLVSRTFHLTFRGRWVIPAAATVCLAAAVLDEAQKAAIPGRHCHWDDAALNAASVLAGLLLERLIRRGIQKKKSNREDA